MGVAKTAMTAVGIGLAAVGAAGVAGGKSILDAMGLKEQTMISFAVTLKTQGLEAQAGKVYDQVQKFASVTPFDTGNVIQAAKQLLAAQVPVKKLNNYLTVSGNLAAGMGTDLDTALKPLLKIRSGSFGEAFQQLQELGLSKKDFEGAGLVFDKSGSYKGSVQDALNAVSGLVTTRFGGMMDRQGKSLFGMISTITSRPFELFTSLDAGKGGPLESVKKVLANLSDLTDFTKAPGNRIAAAFQKSVSTVFSGVFDGLGDLTNPKNATKLVDNIIAVVKGIGDGFTATVKFIKAATRVVVGVFGTITRVVNGLVAAFNFIRPALPFLIAFFGIIAGGAAIVGVIGAIGAMTAGVAAAGGVFAAVAPIIGGVLALVGGPVTLVIAAVAGVAALIVANWGVVGPFLSKVFTGVYALFTGLFTFISSIPAKMLNIGVAIVQGLANGITGAIGSVIGAVKGVANSVIGGLKGVLGIASPSKVAAKLGAFTGQGFGQGLAKSVAGIGAVALTVGSAAASGIGQGVSVPSAAVSVPTARAAPSRGSGRGNMTVKQITVNVQGASPDMSAKEYKTLLSEAVLEAFERAAAAVN